LDDAGGHGKNDNNGGGGHQSIAIIIDNVLIRILILLLLLLLRVSSSSSPSSSAHPGRECGGDDAGGHEGQDGHEAPLRQARKAAHPVACSTGTAVSMVAEDAQ
jgi:hypothetical protein